VVAAVLVALGLPACGTRVPDSFFAEGKNGTTAGRAGASLSSATDDGSQTAEATDGSAGATADEAASGPGTDAGASGDTATGGGATASAGDKVGTDGAKAAVRGGATDVGVTASSIKIGNITSLGGAMPGQFEPWLLGLRTWVTEVNEKGGINGRKILLSVCDDAMDNNRNNACARDLIEKQKVFALVGTNTPDMPSAKYINDSGAPAVGVAPIGNYTSIYHNWFSAYGNPKGNPGCRNNVDDEKDPRYCIGKTPKESNATYKFLRDTVGLTKAAVFYFNIDISAQAGKDVAYNLDHNGIPVAYEAEVQVAEPDYTGHVLNMKDRGVDAVFDTMEINSNIRMMQAMDRQGWRPKAKVSTIAVWGQQIGQQVTGPSKNSLLVTGGNIPYTYTKNPAVARFTTLFKKLFPNKQQHEWNIDGYVGALQFNDAVQALGADVTRAGLVKWFDSQKDYDPHGLGDKLDWRPTDPSYFNQPKPDQSCFSVAQWKDKDFMNYGDDALQCVQGEWFTPRQH
jgi:branched-chain amino acid transport system substrate-binding protein